MNVLRFPPEHRLPPFVPVELKVEIEGLPTERLVAAEHDLYEVVRRTPLAGLVALWFEVTQQLRLRHRPH